MHPGFCSVKLKDGDNLDEVGVGKMMFKCMYRHRIRLCRLDLCGSGLGLL